jgi:hypothetical protein
VARDEKLTEMVENLTEGKSPVFEEKIKEEPLDDGLFEI